MEHPASNSSQLVCSFLWIYLVQLVECQHSVMLGYWSFIKLFWMDTNLVWADMSVRKGRRV